MKVAGSALGHYVRCRHCAQRILAGASTSRDGRADAVEQISLTASSAPEGPLAPETTSKLVSLTPESSSESDTTLTRGSIPVDESVSAETDPGDGDESLGAMIARLDQEASHRGHAPENRPQISRGFLAPDPGDAKAPAQRSNATGEYQPAGAAEADAPSPDRSRPPRPPQKKASVSLAGDDTQSKTQNPPKHSDAAQTPANPPERPRKVKGWYIPVAQGPDIGPFEIYELVQEARRGRLHPQTQLRHSRNPKLVDALSLPGFEAIFRDVAAHDDDGDHPSSPSEDDA